MHLRHSQGHPVVWLVWFCLCTLPPASRSCVYFSLFPHSVSAYAALPLAIKLTVAAINSSHSPSHHPDTSCLSQTPGASAASLWPVVVYAGAHARWGADRCAGRCADACAGKRRLHAGRAVQANEQSEHATVWWRWWCRAEVCCRTAVFLVSRAL